jgi:membrane protein DedA with SNARE-associated domain
MFDRITGLVEQTGYLGIALLMLAENLFPPIPSELIMPLAGFAAARGELGMVGVVAAGTAGALAGALFWYHVGRRVGLERLKRWAAGHGRWLTVSPDDVDRAAAWFDRHGGAAVLVGRLVPAVRTLISVPAGVAGMALPRFLACSAVGTALWTALLAVTGYLLGEQHQKVGDYLDPVSNAILALLALGYLYRVATFRRHGAPWR